MLLLGAVARGFAVPPPTGVAPLNPPAGGFSIDGDLQANTPATNSGDWLVSSSLSGTGGAVLNNAGVPLNPAITFHFIDSYKGSSNNDLVFTGGHKWNDDPTSWSWTAGGASSKTDINNVLLHLAVDGDNHNWVVVAADRLSTSGDSYIDYEFLQNTLTRNSDGTFSSAGPHGGRTLGDLVLSLAFTGGGRVADFFVWKWATNASGGYHYVDVTAMMPAGRVFAALNTNSISVPYGAFGSTNLDANAFAEAAIDLTALLGNFDPCLSFGVRTIMVKTKASQSDTATIEDFIDPIQYTLQIGPSANAGPDQARCTEGESTAFALQGAATAGLYPIVSVGWSVVSGTASLDSTNSLNTVAHVASPTATLRLTVLQANGCTETDDVALSVKAQPTCAITGPSLLCPRSSAQFSAPAGMNSYAWAISGNGFISGATNQRTVTVTAGSACGENLTVVLNVTSNACSSACAVEAAVADTTPPTLTCPPDRVLECPADTRTNATGVATATDDCGLVTVTYSDSLTNGCGGTMTIARMWTATDGCNNSVSCVQTITVRDTTKPIITCPPNRTLECPADTQPGATGFATATDTCGSTTIDYTDSVVTNCGGTKVIARTWTATDACGNASSCVQTITVRDTIRPVLACPPDQTLECPADTSTNATGVATATDGCSAVAVSFSDAVTTNCGGTKVIIRTWTGVDECGNSTNSVQRITVRDTTPPTITCPPDLTLECPADTRTNATGVATATDGCGKISISYGDAVTTNCAATKIIARTWRVTDECGNQASCTQTITVRDTTAPTITCPPSVTRECPADTRTNATGVATATDGCGQVTVSYSDVVTTNCAATKVIARTWTATDVCGNSANCVQTITVRDTTAPTITCPPDRTLECPADTSTNATGVATATDGCGKVTVTYNDSVSNGCAGTTLILRTWTATDDCGNTASCVQTITRRDTKPPILTCPPDRTLQCPADTRTNATGVATATDACGNVAIAYSDAVTTNCGATKIIARTWTAVDECGNQSSCVQTITVRDTTPPTISCPPDRVLECPADTSTNATGVATATDACGQTTITYQDAVTTNCAATKLILRTWTATDECGNQANCIQTITVRDTTPPAITCPPNLTLECPADTRTNATGVATATDGCGKTSISYSDVVTTNCAATKVIARTWTATDECGNQASCVQTITVRDTTAPTINCPPSATLECPADTRTNATGVATASDGCGQVTVSFSDVVTTNCAASKVIARTWTATDACGNTASCVQTITVRDTTAPTIACPPNLTLECPAVTTTNATGVATATDGCGQVTITYTDAGTTNCAAARVIARTWRATDTCGNSSTCVQTITVRDSTAPTIICPANLFVECGASTAPSATGAATATDGCGAATVSYIDSVSNTCGGTKIISRRWTAVDACGNASNVVQTITVRDTTPPLLTTPSNRVLDCPGDTRTNVTGVASATDGCGSVTISYSDVVSNGCGLTRTVQRTWTATDQCGNSASGVQTITVRDNPPTISCPTVRAQCVADVPPPYANLAAFQAAGGVATDACDAALDFMLVSDSGLVGRCPGTVTRVYRVTDDCGYSAQCTQTITVDDTIAPVLTCPTNITVECGGSLDPANIGKATATDNCSTNVAITYSDAAIQSEYDLKFYVADPDSGTGPYSPTYLKFGPGSLPCPDSARLTGRALDPLRNAVAFAQNGQLDALTSIGNVPMAFGQIVPFEVVIQASGGPGPERGTIEFTADWSTYTTSNNRFGYDTNYMVYCAFVDAADPGSIDPNNNARVESYSSAVVNAGTIAEAIRGTFRVSGLDAGDRVVVEIWVILMSSMPEHTGGTVAASLVSAQKASVPAVPITVGVQTDSLGNLSKITALPAPQSQLPLGPLPPQPPVLPGLTVNVIDRTWRATDDCGNTSTCVQRITVRDTTPPALTIPADLVLECPATDTSTNVTGVAIAQDGCGTTDLTYSDVISNLCGGTKVISRTWTATDLAGNSTNGVQIITVRDTTAPSITCPPNLTLECPAITTTNATGVATATDACGNVTLSYSDVVTTNCAATKVIARTWTATDACGNTATCLQTITVRDSTAPTINCPVNLIVECGASTSPSATGIASATDGCGAATVTYTDSVSNTCGGAKIISRRWSAVDTCGNSSNVVQTILVRDTTPPTISCPPNRIVAAGESWSFDTPTATDTCSGVTLRVLGTVTNATGSPVLMTRTWEAADQCGNTATCAQTITVTSGPLLELTRSAIPNTLMLRWPELALGYQVECSDNLRSNWIPMPVTSFLSNSFNCIQFTPGPNAQFYRLRKSTQ